MLLLWRQGHFFKGDTMSFTYKWNLKDLENIEKNGYKVFSCFAGGGG